MLFFAYFIIVSVIAFSGVIPASVLLALYFGGFLFFVFLGHLVTLNSKGYTNDQIKKWG